MSYMEHDFVPAGGIQELTFDEVEQVDGGIAPLIVAGLVVGGVILVAFAAGVVSGYLANS